MPTGDEDYDDEEEEDDDMPALEGEEEQTKAEGKKTEA